MQFFSSGKIYNFMKWRAVFIGISSFMVLASLVLIFAGYTRYGTDFRGGTEVEVEFNSAVSTDGIRNAVTAAGFSAPDVVRVEDVGAQNHYLLRVQEVSSLTDAQVKEVYAKLCFGENLPKDRCPEAKQAIEVKVSPGGEKISARFREEPDLGWIRTEMLSVPGLKLRSGATNPEVQNARTHKVDILLESKGDQIMDALRTALGADKVPAEPLRVEWIGPKAGAQLRDSAVVSLGLALVLIMAYIAFRFDVRYAPGAVLSLIHDVIVTVGILTVLPNREITLSTVAGLLTIIGYSVNDTVVIYDRVRENMGKLRGVSFSRLIDVSISETLSRTLLTNGSVILSLLMFFFWGTGSIKDFVLTMVIGMILGTYSTIAVALQATHFFDHYVFAKLAASQPAKAPGKPGRSAGAVI